MRFVGIDPGVTGAIAMLDSDGGVVVVDMPRDTDGVDGALLHRLLIQWAPNEVILERTHAGPKGSKANYSQGDTNGSIRTAVHILKIPLVWVTPMAWQRHFNLYGGGFSEGERKNRSRWRAQELFPVVADELGRVKDHNRAEALLICEYGKRTSITAAVAGG